jgi:tRNA pseudouridine13 synthase
MKHARDEDVKTAKVIDDLEPKTKKRKPFCPEFERSVGILSFTTGKFDLVIHGSLKERYSDFIVHEVQPGMEVVRLTTQEIPEALSWKNHTKVECPAEEYEKELEVFKSLVGEAKCAEVVTLFDEEPNAENVLRRVEIGSFETKSDRKAIHESIKKCFGTRLMAMTNDKKGIELVRSGCFGGKRVGKRSFDVRSSNSWPESLSPHLRFTLYKENMETISALSLLSKCTGLRTNMFQTCGTKDKRAVTTQRVSVHKVSAEKIMRGAARIARLGVGNFEYSDISYFLGHLEGNVFDIVIRDFQYEVCPRDDEEKMIDKSPKELLGDKMEELRSKGFINYYGLQRFGMAEPGSHMIGLSLLCGEWKVALEMILHTCVPFCQPDRVGQRFLLPERSEEIEELLPKIPKRFTIECSVVQGLIRHGPKNYLEAFNSIPRNTRMIYIHAFQSFVWNLAASTRVELFGCEKVITGDMVVKGNAKNAVFEFVDETNISEYNVQDVILPLPSAGAEYPRNVIGERYQEILKEYGVDEKMFSAPHWKGALTGDNRKLVCVPSDFEWQIVPYDAVENPLIVTDMDAVKPLSEEEQSLIINGHPEGAKQALRIHFFLPSSSYATMLVREFSLQ